ncbi:MFS transporter [Kordiimonas sp.]|uniref:MFS transporter n=1 Tax=Kordiimonas sp. TaxID=1970157 RepID=UPI003A91E1A9
MRKHHEARERAIMTFVFLTVFLGWVGFSIPFPVFSPLFLTPAAPLLDEGVSNGVRIQLLGVGLALYPLGQIAGSFLLGRASDRYGHKQTLMFALALTVLGSLMLALGVMSSLIYLLLLGRFIAGLGEGSVAIVQSLASDASSAQTKARNFAFIGIAMDLGFVVGPLAGGAILGDVSSGVSPMHWALPFWLAAVLFVVNFFLVPVFLKGGGGAVHTAASTPRSMAGAMMPLMLVSFCTFWSIMSFFDFFPVYFVQVYGTEPMQLGINAALLSAPLVAAGLVVGRLVNRVGARAVAMFAFALMGLGQYAFLQAGTELAHIPAVIAIAIGITFGQTATSVLVSDAAPTETQGQALGLYRAVTVLAAAMAALTGGWLAAANPGHPFLGAVLACGIGGVILCLPRQKRVQC